MLFCLSEVETLTGRQKFRSEPTGAGSVPHEIPQQLVNLAQFQILVMA